MSLSKILVPTLEGAFKEGTVEEESALFHEHSLQTISTTQGEKAIWAVVSDFNSLETLKMLSVCCDAFRKLGRKELADRIWTEAKKEDFGLNPLSNHNLE